MKKLYCVLYLLSTLLSIGFSQEKYLEIIVEDTVHVEADRIYYVLTLTEHEEGDPNKLDNELSKVDLELVLESYPSIKLINNNSTALGSSASYERYYGKTNKKTSSLTLEIKDKEEFVSLYGQLSEYNNITAGRISNLSCNDNEAVEVKAIKKIMAKGQAKADKIAALMDAKIDRLTEFIELPTDSKWKNLSKGPGWTSYPSLSLRQDNEGELSFDRTTIIVLKQAKIKYILK